jgi:deazaflavin-dependent oxidoreductase (nitroreductase family)
LSVADRRLTRVENRIGVWLYRTLGGRLSSGSRRVTVLLLTTPGRRTGVSRPTCVRYLERPEGLLVWGTGGSSTEPDWFRNLRAAGETDVQIRRRHLRARVRELVGDERDQVWNEVVLREVPEVEKDARRARRVIPVAVLEAQ